MAADDIAVIRRDSSHFSCQGVSGVASTHKVRFLTLQKTKKRHIGEAALTQRAPAGTRNPGTVRRRRRSVIGGRLRLQFIKLNDINELCKKA